MVQKIKGGMTPSNRNMQYYHVSIMINWVKSIIEGLCGDDDEWVMDKVKL